MRSRHPEILSLFAALCFAAAAVIDGTMWAKTHSTLDAVITVAFGVSAAAWVAIYFIRRRTA